MPSKSLPVKCDSAADLQRELSTLQSPLQLIEAEETWEKIAKGFSRLGALAQAGACDYPSLLVPFLRSMSRPVANAAASERSRLSSTAIEMLSHVAQGLGKGFEPLLHLYLPVLLTICGRPNKVFVARARAGVETIIENTQLPSILTHLVNSLADKSISLRQTAISGILACLNCFNPPDLEKEPRALDIENAIRITATDANGDVRKISRQVFDAYRILLPARVDAFTYPLSSTAKKYLNITTTATSRPGSSMSTHSTRSVVTRPASAMASVGRADDHPKAPPKLVHSRSQSSSTFSAKPSAVIHARLVVNEPGPSQPAPSGSQDQGSRPPPKIGQTGNKPSANPDKNKAMPPPPTIPLRRSQSVAAKLRPGLPPQRGSADVASVATTSNPRRVELDKSAQPTRYRDPSTRSEPSGKDIEPLKPSKKALQMTPPPLRSSQESMDNVVVGARRVPMPPTETAIETPAADPVVPDQNAKPTLKSSHKGKAPASSTAGSQTKESVQAAKPTEPSQRHVASSSSAVTAATSQKIRGRGLSQPTLSQLARMKATATERKVTARTTTTQARAGTVTSKTSAKYSGPDSIAGLKPKPKKKIEISKPGSTQTAKALPLSAPEESIDPKEVLLPDSRPPSPILETNEEDVVQPAEISPPSAVPEIEPDIDKSPSPTPPKSPISNSTEVVPPPTEPSQESVSAEKTPIKSSVSFLNGDVTSDKTPISALLSSIQRGFMFTPGSPLSPPHSYGQDAVDESYRDDESIVIQGWN
ncbi:hypothetical protein EVG20_g69 [Dentipellis fragilis]|uniref:TOG domain-containing protein n=1 Tax=Dentipellis fragilis TaxID=205917 RepID=A0A4Y9ZEB8_9AGAM|nr:hypothetical protein EVG20_g69 [Dentipellis fragilis]